MSSSGADFQSLRATSVTGPGAISDRISTLEEEIVRNNLRLVSTFFLVAVIAGQLVRAGTSHQDQPGIIKPSVQVTARTLNFHGKNRNMWSWVPFFRFTLTRDRNSGDVHDVEYTIPGLRLAEVRLRGDLGTDSSVAAATSQKTKVRLTLAQSLSPSRSGTSCKERTRRS